MLHSMATTPHELTAREVFARNLRRARRWKDISQEELADRAGLNRNYVSEVERKQRNISVDNMGRFARALDLPLSDLLDVAFLKAFRDKEL